MADSRRRLLDKPLNPLRFKRLGESDLSGTIALAAEEPCPGCVNTLDDGPLPLTDSTYLDDFAGGGFFTHTVNAGSYEINGSVPGNVGANYSWGFFCYDPFTPVYLVGNPPAQLRPCGHGVQVTLDWSVTIVSPGTEGQNFRVQLVRVWSGGVAALAGGDSGALSANADASGSINLAIDGADVPCGDAIGLVLSGNGSLSDTSGGATKTLHLELANIVLTDLGA